MEENNKKYMEMICNINDLREGDQVIGSDGKWHEIEILPSFIPEDMYEIFFFKANNNYNVEFLGFENDDKIDKNILKDIVKNNDNNEFKTFLFKDEFEDQNPIFSVAGEILGTVECSGTHEWSILDINGKTNVLTTKHIFEKLPFIFGCHIGNQYGPFIGFMKKNKS